MKCAVCDDESLKGYFTVETLDGKYHCGGCHKNISKENWGEHGEKHRCPALKYGDEFNGQ